MRASRWWGVAAGLGAGALVVLLPAVGGARIPGSAVSLPDRIASYSHVTADVSEQPAGRAIALYQHGFGVEFLDFPQAVVLAADADAYRRLDVAEARAGAETQGDPAPMLLSPDGTSVAVGDHDTADPDLVVVDLATGDVVRHPLPAARSIRPVAWSTDGGRLAYLADSSPTNPHIGHPLAGDLVVLDLTTDETTTMPGSGAVAAAFSPDGRRLAVERTSPPGVEVVDLATGRARSVFRGGSLPGPAAWSPDGRLLAIGTEGTTFVDVVSSGTEPWQVPHGLTSHAGVVGWTADREAVLVDHGDDVSRVVAQPLDGGPGRELTRVEDTGSYGVGSLQLATALLPGVEVRPASEPDRGPLPLGLRGGLALVAGVVAAWAAARVAARPAVPLP